MPATRTEQVIKVAHFCCVSLIQLSILAGIVVLAGISYSLVFTDTVTQNTSITVERARQIACPIPLPETAQNIRFVYAHHWFSYVMYARFKADPQVCHDWAKTVIAAHDAESKQESKPTKFQHLTSPPEIKDWGEFGPIPWFNLNRIVDGLVKTDGDLTIWIDNDRGIFYCRIMQPHTPE